MSSERYEGSSSPAGSPRPGSPVVPGGSSMGSGSMGSGTSTGQGSTSQSGTAADRMGDQAQSLTEQAKQQGQQLADQAKEQGQQLAETVSHSAEQGKEKAADAALGLAGTLREKADTLPGDKTTELAYQAADSLERGASYVRDADVDRMRGDFESMIRKYPVQSIAIGLAAGFLLARMFR